MLILNLVKVIVKLYYLIFHTTLSVLYQLVLSCTNYSTTKTNSEHLSIKEIANDDVVEALDMEVEALRNYRATLLEKASAPSTSVNESAKLIKQAAAIQTKMMKLNEQALKRRDKEEI